MKFTFIGNPGRRDDSNTVTIFGITFPLRVPVEVTDERAIAKLKVNNHFSHDNDDSDDGEGEAPAVAVPAAKDDAPVVASEGTRRARKERA